MNELITITTNEQGSSVVSARELHALLEVRSKFADWIKNRIIQYKFLEDTDYVIITNDEGFSRNLEKGGRPELDYALTLDMAKQLAMVEKTEKGQEVRLYFIKAENTLRQLAAAAPAALSTEQVLIQLVSQSNQLLANQQQQLDQLRTDIEQIKAGSGKPSRLKPTPSLPFGPPTGKGGKVRPLRPLRGLVNLKVNDYCAYHQVSPSETYNYLYKRLNDVYGVNVYRLIRANGESLIDAVERYGHLDRLYSLIMGELAYPEE